MTLYCGRPECGLNRGMRCGACERLRIDRMAALLFAQGRLLAERQDRQDFFAAAARTRRISQIADELAAIREEPR